MANDLKQINSELNKLNTELESLLVKQAESFNQQKRYEEDFKNQYGITDVKDLDNLINDSTNNNDDMADLLGEMNLSASDSKINYTKIREEYNLAIKEFEKQQTALI